MRRTMLYGLQLAWFMLGLFIFGFAISLMVKAGLGVASWDVLHLGLTHYLSFTFGQIMIGSGVICVIVAVFLGVRPTLGTVLNMIFIGVFVDLINKMALLPDPVSNAWRWSYLLFGIVLCGLATGLYITAALGTGPRDSLMVGLHQVTGWRIGPVRTLIEVSVVLLGYLLSGPIGWGTLVFSLTIGWTTEYSLKFFYWCGNRRWFKQLIGSMGEINTAVSGQQKA
ncbi:membrane protein [Desulforamulus ruminis]|uniref:YczE/YyaS/YitT family protein n=1 Tax=Desulforamulus ruminis TaxID=1564 RepID=UPI002FDAD132